MSEISPAAQVVPVEEADRPRIFASLASAFSADPLMRWMFPAAEEFYRAAMGAFYDAFGGGAIALGSAYRTPDAEGVALWYPPGNGPDEERLLPLMLETVRESIHEDCFALFEAMEAYHPDEDCWYLAVLGVDHAYQGRGHGAQLMKHALAHIDSLQLPAYLESSNPLNLSLYRRHGFEEMGVIASGSAPRVVPMYRAARD